MTETQVDTRNENEGTAVEAGSKATERFAASGKLSELRVPKERVSTLAGALINDFLEGVGRVWLAQSSTGRIK